jgi:hypothetical protein
MSKHDFKQKKHDLFKKLGKDCDKFLTQEFHTHYDYVCNPDIFHTFNMTDSYCGVIPMILSSACTNGMKSRSCTHITDV